MNGRIALFDLDRTLLDINSGTLWLRHEWSEGNIGVRDAMWAGWWLMKYSLGIGEGMDAAYREAVRTLRGEPETRIVERTQAWFDEQVRHHLRPGASEALERHREAGDRLVLATTSSPYEARAAMEAYGLDDFVSTVFEVVDGVFTGEVSEPAWGANKAKRVEEWAERGGHDLERAVFYTDSMTDLTLLERVAEPVCVNPDRRLQRIAVERGWPIVDWGTAEEPPGAS